jgi:hypothetical protein
VYNEKVERSATLIQALPRTLSLSLAGALCGLSGQAFKRLYIFTSRVSWQPDEYFDWDGQLFIKRRELEQALGRPISLQDVQAADQKLQRKRDYMKRYRRRKESH